ncbi:extensin-like domain-containing protein [Flavisphingomonas formosensis]|uniref:extensin-like domain-containing protein n=1 Tax=Flavisphingomonas formosensis TaxID=861534 RepID=UPI0012F8BDD9|nr:extensin family protein [Sphingomonas formosensis]
MLRFLVVLALFVAAAFVVFVHARRAPQDMPWTRLDLGQPIGLFTGRKLAGLTQAPARCRALLDRAGVRFTAEPARREGGHCGYDDLVELDPGGALAAAWRPELKTACPVAAGLSVWLWEVVQPAAQHYIGSRVVAVDHYGSYNCRRMYGANRGPWSEHATADAIDVAGFRFADGTRITIKRDWKGDDARATFLHVARNGACKLFSTVLSPDYNAAHADHLHLDQARRGEWGWRACR